MGAWGAKAFENDAALDWLGRLEAEGLSALHDALALASDADEDEYLDVDDGAAAIAAAEIVAAALGKGRDRLTKQAIAWLDANPEAIVSDDRIPAALAVARVLGPSSELSELAGSDEASPWHADVQALLSRLGGAPPRGERRSKEGARGGKQREMMKTVLLTFLAGRGLVPTEEEHARIAAATDDDQIHGWLARAPDAPTVAAVLDPKAG